MAVTYLIATEHIREHAALSRLQARVLCAFLIGPQEADTVARSIHYSKSWTQHTIRQLREKSLLMVASVYHIGRLKRCHYTLTRKGLAAAKESICQP